jgi:hypothetical protein
MEVAREHIPLVMPGRTPELLARKRRWPAPGQVEAPYGQTLQDDSGRPESAMGGRVDRETLYLCQSLHNLG